MSVVTDMYDTLNADAGVRAYVGISSSPQESKVYAGKAPENTALPYIVFFTVNRTPFSTVPGTDDMHRYTIQIRAHSNEYDEAQAINDAVHDALEGNGYMDDRREFYETPFEGDIGTYSDIMEWNFIA